MSSLKKKIVLFAALILGNFTSTWGADCAQLNLAGNTAVTVTTANNGAGQTLTVSRNGNGSACDYFIVISNGTSTSAATRSLKNGSFSYPMQFRQTSTVGAIIKSFTEASTVTDVIVGNMPAGTNASQTKIYYPVLDLSTTRPVGSYSDIYSISIYGGTMAAKSSAIQRASLNVTYTYGNTTFVELSLVDSGAAYSASDVAQTLDFGELATGAVRGFDLILKYNAGYRLSMSSLNSGVLKNSVASIPYTMSLNGSNVALTNTMSTVRTNLNDSGAATYSSGNRLPVEVTIGNASGALAGTYTDTVSVSIAAP